MRTEVVGNGNDIVGHHFVDQMIHENTVSANATNEGDAAIANNHIWLEVMVLSAETGLADDRVHLSKYFLVKQLKN